jgi:hypothetical protein
MTCLLAPHVLKLTRLSRRLYFDRRRPIKLSSSDDCWSGAESIYRQVNRQGRANAYSKEDPVGRTYQSIVINAPVERVWRAIRNFHDLGWAPNVVTSVDVVGNKKGTAVGAGRVLNQGSTRRCVN